MNVNPFGSSSIYTNITPSTMNANQSCGLRFGASSDDYDYYNSSVPKKKESFWQKWKKAIIGGFVTVGVGILGVVGYNKGWFSKAKNVASSRSSQPKPNNFETALKTLGLEDLKVDGKDIKNLLKNDTKTVSQKQFTDVVIAIHGKVKNSSNDRKIAAVTILEQLRKNLAQDAIIKGFDKNKEIENVNVLDEIIEASKPGQSTKPEQTEVIHAEEEPVEEEKPVEPVTDQEKSEFGEKITELYDKLEDYSYDDKTAIAKDINDLFTEPKFIDSTNVGQLANILNMAMWKGVFSENSDNDKKQIQEYIDTLFKNGNEMNATWQLADVLDTAMRKGVFSENSDNDKKQIQGYIDTLFENVDKTNATWQLADVLDTAMLKGVFSENSDNDKKQIQGYIAKLFKNGNETNAEQLAKVLNTAMWKGVFSENVTKIQGYIAKLFENGNKMNTTWPLANILNMAMQQRAFSYTTINADFISSLLEFVNTHDNFINSEKTRNNIGYLLKQVIINKNSFDINKNILSLVNKVCSRENSTIQNATDGAIACLTAAIKQGLIIDKNLAFKADVISWTNVDPIANALLKSSEEDDSLKTNETFKSLVTSILRIAQNNKYPYLESISDLQKAFPEPV